MNWIKRLTHNPKYENKLLNSKALLKQVNNPIVYPKLRMVGEKKKEKRL